MSIEILAKDEKREPRKLVVTRLVDRGVDNRSVESCHEFQINDPLQCPRAVCPIRQSRGHRFRRNQILAVKMRDRGRALDIGDIAWLCPHLAAVRPHRRHRHIGVAAHRHVVAERRPVVLQRLAVDDQAILMCGLGDHAIVFRRHQVGKCAPIIEQKALAILARSDQQACQSWHPGHRIIATQPLELGNHLWRPVRRTHFNRIGKDRANALGPKIAARGILIHLDIVIHIAPHGLTIEFIDFEAGRFGRCRVIGGAEQRPAKAQHLPSALWRRPVEAAVGTELRGQIDHFLGTGARCAVDQGGQREIVRRQSESGLGLVTINPGFGRKEQLPHAVIRLRPARQSAHRAEIYARCWRHQVGHFKRQGRDRHPELSRRDRRKADSARDLLNRQINDFVPTLAITACLKRNRNRWPAEN